MKTKTEKTLDKKKSKQYSKKLNLIKPATSKNSEEFSQLTKTKLLQSFLESFPYATLLISAKSKEIVASNKIGIEAGVVLGEKCYKSWANRDKPCPWCQISKLQKTDQHVCCESKINGQIFDTHWLPISKDLFLHFAENVTKHKYSEKQTLQQKEELQIIFDSVPALIFYKDKNNRFIKVNKALADISNLSIDDMEGKSAFELYPENAEKYWKDDLEVIKSRIAKKNIIEPLVINNETKWLKTDKIPYKDSHGNIIGIIGISQDFTELNKINEELTTSNQRLINEQIALTKSQSALIEVLKSIEIEQNEKMKTIQSNINKTILPYLQNLENGASESQFNNISLLKKNLSEITSSFISKLESLYTKLSPRELEICSMLKDGMTSKKIADHFNTSEGTVRNQRKSIRKKLNINNKSINLSTFLQTKVENNSTTKKIIKQ